MIFDKIMIKRLGKNLILLLCIFTMLFTVVPPSAKASWETTEDMGSYVRHSVWDNVWQNTSGYQSQWVSGGYNNCYTAYNDVWVNYWENGVWSYVNYWENGYWSYVDYWDYGNGNWGGGYYQWIVTSWGGGYYQWIVTSSGGGYYDRQYYTTCNWVDTSHYESVWVPSGYYATQLINQYDVQKPAPVPTTAPTPVPTPVPTPCSACGGGDAIDELYLLTKIDANKLAEVYAGSYDYLWPQNIKDELTHLGNLWFDLHNYSNENTPLMKQQVHEQANKVRDIALSKVDWTVTRLKTFIPFKGVTGPFVDNWGNIGILDAFFDNRSYDLNSIKVRSEQYILAWSSNGDFGKTSTMSTKVFNFNGKSQGFFTALYNDYASRVLTGRHNNSSFHFDFNPYVLDRGGVGYRAHISAPNGLIPLSPSIDYSIQFEFFNDTMYIFGGTNGFPGYEIWSTARNKIYNQLYGFQPSHIQDIWKLVDLAGYIWGNKTIPTTSFNINGIFMF